ncbi:MAG: HNH endonuclease [Gammaproteobacteria bacterium]|nr:HNH endonuclease [Gammaproteobacteria bacterium]
MPKAIKRIGSPKSTGNKIKLGQRQSANRRGYNSKWQKARKAYLASNPLCVFCKEKGIIKSATVIDHIIPHKGDMLLFWDKSNWQPLCKRCHDSDKQRAEKRNK